MMNLTKYRDQFPILAHKVHLGNCSQSPKSLAVAQAMESYIENWSTIGMDWAFWMEGVAKAKASFARMIHAHPDEIAITSSVSDATNAIASALPIGSGQRRKVVTTTSEFPTVGHVWLAHAAKQTLDVRFVHSDSGDYPATIFEPEMDSDTAILSVHHVAYYNGAKQDLATLAKLAHHHGAYLYVDAYQSLGTCDIDVHQLGIDMLASGNLKYLLGFPGVAFLYVRKDIAEQLEPANTGWFGRENPFSFDATKLNFAPATRRFDTGTPPVMAAFAARGGMDFLYDVGLSTIETRIQALSAYTIEGILGRNLLLASPTDPTKKGSATAIRVSDSHAVEMYLAQQNIIASARADVIRIAPHFFTEEWEIDKALDAIVEYQEKVSS